MHTQTHPQYTMCHNCNEDVKSFFILYYLSISFNHYLISLPFSEVFNIINQFLQLKIKNIVNNIDCIMIYVPMYLNKSKHILHSASQVNM